MTSAWLYYLANSLWLAGGWRMSRSFRAALLRPRTAQQTRLLRLLRRNARSEYGRRYRFARLRSIAEFQDTVPLVTDDSLSDEIDAIKRGRQGILTQEPVLWMEKSAGSTGPAKYIPYTASLMREFHAAVAPWMADLYGHNQQMKFGASYWSISPLAAERELTSGGLPIGCEDERSYFRALDRRLLNLLILTPAAIARITDMDSSRYATLRFLLQTPDLSFISIWSPSFLTLLVRFMGENAESLIADLRRGTLTPPVPLSAELGATLARGLSPAPERAAELERIFARCGGLPPTKVWPGLKVISCWGSASARNFLPELQALFSGDAVQPKGLLATEGVISVPLCGRQGAALALTSHFFEFIPVNDPSARPLLADELEAGATYKVLLTTGGGLYRYDIADWIQVVGKVGATPLVEFIGKANAISDLCGEKLHAAQVEGILNQSLSELGIVPAFVMLAPDWSRPPRYFLFIEAPGLRRETLDRLAESVETRLSEGHHYSYCRRLGQLGPVKGMRVREGTHRYLERCTALGQRAGGVKPAVLHGTPGWTAWFRETAEHQGEDVHEPVRV